MKTFYNEAERHVDEMLEGIVAALTRAVHGGPARSTRPARLPRASTPLPELNLLRRLPFMGSLRPV